MSIFASIANALGGSAIGSVTAAVSRWHDDATELEKAKIEAQTAKDNMDHEYRLAQLQSESQKALAQISADSAIQVADQTSLQAAINSDKATYSGIDTTKTSIWLIAVDAIRGFIRPFLTGLLTCATLYYAYAIFSSGWHFEPSQGYALFSMMMDNILGLTGLAISYWFGSRPSQGRK